jgi:plasmid maintenance system killer protein
VNVAFRNRRLERAYRERNEAVRLWGVVVGRRYLERLDLLFFRFDTVQELYVYRELDFHPLTGNRAGQHALRLTGQMRLIVSVTNEESVIVEEVVDYHG